jgi:hypothetical protein
MRLLRPAARIAGLGIILGAGSAALAAPLWEVTLVGDMYPAGEAAARPTPAKPAFYFPIVMGFTELGAVRAGDRPPPVGDMVHRLAAVLAAQGYLVTRQVPGPAGGTALSPPPSLLLVFHWGALRPEKFNLTTDVAADNAAAPAAVVNRSQMLGLIGGNNLDAIADFGLQARELQEMQYDRYFVMVSAYDFDAYFRRHQLVRLWVAKMSMPIGGTSMGQAMPALIAAGGPVLGRGTVGPKTAEVPAVPAGRVEVGTPAVVP